MTSAVAEQAETTTKVEDAQGKFILEIMDDSGHSRVMWDPDDPKEVAAAQKAFDDAIGKGYAAFEMQPGGKTGKQISKFDPYAGRILMQPPMAGG